MKKIFKESIAECCVMIVIYGFLCGLYYFVCKYNADLSIALYLALAYIVAYKARLWVFKKDEEDKDNDK